MIHSYAPLLNPLPFFSGNGAVIMGYSTGAGDAPPVACRGNTVEAGGANTVDAIGGGNTVAVQGGANTVDVIGGGNTVESFWSNTVNEKEC